MDNIDELKNQLDNADEAAEEIEEKDDDQEENEEGADDEGQDEGAQDEGTDDEDGQDQGAGEGEQFSMPEKFKGKSAEEIAKSYTELERMNSKAVGDLQKQIDELKKNPPAAKKEDGKDDGEIDWDEEAKKLTPKQFAQKIIAEAKKASQGVYHEANQTKSEVTKEINDAKKAYPNLTKNQAYKETVVAIMEAAAAQGQVMKLKDACAKVEGLIGEKKKITDTEEKRMKQTKAQIETMGGSPAGGGQDSEEAKIKNGMMKGSGGALGGLGI